MQYNSVEQSRLELSKKFVYGGVSAGISATLKAPLDWVKLLLQNQAASKHMQKKKVHYTGMFDCIRKVLREEGALSFWKGNSMSILWYIPVQTFNFTLKDSYKKILNPYQREKEPWKHMIGNMLSGGAAGSTTLMIVYPLDYIRTRAAMNIGWAKSEREFKSIGEMLSRTYRMTGIRGMYRGSLTSILVAFQFRSMYFGLYDTFWYKLG